MPHQVCELIRMGYCGPELSNEESIDVTEEGSHRARMVAKAASALVCNLRGKPGEVRLLQMYGHDTLAAKGAVRPQVSHTYRHKGAVLKRHREAMGMASEGGGKLVFDEKNDRIVASPDDVWGAAPVVVVSVGRRQKRSRSRETLSLTRQANASRGCARVHSSASKKAYGTTPRTADTMKKTHAAMYAAAQHDCMVTGEGRCHVVIMCGPESGVGAGSSDIEPPSHVVTVNADANWQHRWRQVSMHCKD